MTNHKLKDFGPCTRIPTVGKTTSNKSRRRNNSREKNKMDSTTIVNYKSPIRVVVAKRHRSRRITRKVRT